MHQQMWRPVIDLSRFNTFLVVERFKMKTLESIRASQYLTVLRVDIKSGEVRIQTNSDVFVHDLRIPPRFSPCITHSREIAQSSGFDPMLKVKTCFDCNMMSLIGLLASTEKMVLEGCLHMRPFQFHLKEYWRYPQSFDILLPWSETFSAHLEWWQIPQT